MSSAAVLSFDSDSDSGDGGGGGSDSPSSKQHALAAQAARSTRHVPPPASAAGGAAAAAAAGAAAGARHTPSSSFSSSSSSHRGQNGHVAWLPAVHTPGAAGSVSLPALVDYDSSSGGSDDSEVHTPASAAAQPGSLQGRRAVEGARSLSSSDAVSMRIAGAPPATASAHTGFSLHPKWVIAGTDAFAPRGGKACVRSASPKSVAKSRGLKGQTLPSLFPARAVLFSNSRTSLPGGCEVGGTSKATPSSACDPTDTPDSTGSAVGGGKRKSRETGSVSDEQAGQEGRGLSKASKLGSTPDSDIHDRSGDNGGNAEQLVPTGKPALVQAATSSQMGSHVELAVSRAVDRARRLLAQFSPGTPVIGDKNM